MVSLEDVNPLIPAQYDLVWTAVVVISILVVVAAVVLIARAVVRR